MEDQVSAELYRRLLPTVWEFNIKGKIMGMNNKVRTVIMSCSGFCVKKGYLMTCGHITRMKDVRVQARRVDNTVPWRIATLVEHKNSCDLALFKIDKTKDEEFVVASLALSGVLNYGDPVFTISTPSQLSASFASGIVAYPCIHNPPLPNDSLTTEHYEVDISLSQDFRILAHFCNKSWLQNYRNNINNDDDDDKAIYSYMTNYHPNVPIIQISGMACAPGCSGGAVFNSNGEVVGCYIANRDFGIAIHISMLRKFLLSALPNEHSPDEERETPAKKKDKKKKKRREK